MTYVVIKVGQLHEHHLFKKSINEASRLIKLENEDFYIAKLINRCSKNKIEWLALGGNKI